MVKDDYFVIAYRILAYLYKCFISGEKPDTVMFGPDALKINQGYWTNVIESLYLSLILRGLDLHYSTNKTRYGASRNSKTSK